MRAAEDVAVAPSTVFARRVKLIGIEAAFGFGSIDSEGQHFIRISVATAAADLEEAVRRIAEAVKDEVGFRAFVASGTKLTLE